MKFIKVEWDARWRGFSLDPGPYTARLPAILPELPVGARRFAADPGHYDFGSTECVKDLKPSLPSLGVGGEGRLSLSFEPNPWKHERGLSIWYSRVSGLTVQAKEPDMRLDELGTVMLDEVLPAPGGCTHEIVLIGGTIQVTCADLEAAWT